MARRASALQGPQRARPSGPAPAPRRRHLRVVPSPSGLPSSRPAKRGSATTAEKTAPKNASRVLVWVLGWTVVAACVFGLVLLNVFVAQGSFQLAELREEVSHNEREYRQMRYEVAKAESPQKVAEMASHLGLVPPAQQEYIVGRPRTMSPATGEPEAPREENMKALLEAR